MKYGMMENLKMRIENFGGVIQTEKGIFILNKKQYHSLQSFSVPRVVKNPSVIFQKLLEIGAIYATEG